MITEDFSSFIQADYDNFQKIAEMVKGNYNMVAFAIEYAKLGFQIFPCNNDKTPVVDLTLGLTHGVKDATDDLHTIARIWYRQKQANIGWAIPEGYIVIDCDVLKDKNKKPILDSEGKTIPQGLITFKQIMEQYSKGSEIHTLTIKTQSGGTQFYFKLTEEQKKILKEKNTEITNRTNLWDYVDLKTYGGYVLLPPSRGLLGKYEFMEVNEIADLPDWLFKLLLEKYKPNTIIVEKMEFKEISKEKIQKIIEILLPYWDKADHRRNDLTLAINGMLALRGVKPEVRKYILSELCRLTGKGCDHVIAFKYTDRRLQNGKPVRGRASFEKMINEIEGVIDSE